MTSGKKIIASILLLFLILAGSAGCSAVTSGELSQKEEEKRLTISTSFYPLYIMTLNIVRDVPGVELHNIAPVQAGCLHDYQLTTNDMKKLEKSEVLIINGAGMENFLEKVISKFPSLEIVEASKGLDLIEDSHGHGVNPHVWVSISGAMGEVKNICNCLKKIDPFYAELYQKNCDDYLAKLEELKEEMHRSLASISDKRIITFHEAFPYFAQEFGLEIVDVIEGESGSQPSAQELARIIEIIKETEVKAIFTDPQYSPLAAEAIAKETQAGVYVLDSAVAGDLEPDAYLRIMEKNMKTLVEALK